MSSLRTRYAGIVRRRIAWLAFFLGALLLSLATDIATGPSGLSVSEVLRGLFRRDALSGPQGVILWEIRLPQALMAVLVGLALGLAGAETQTVLNNPLASPYTLGLTSAATVGAALALVFGWSAGGLGQHVVVPGLAFLCALGASLLVLTLARIFGTGVDLLILFGIALVFLGNAIVALLQFIADSAALQQVVFWTLGSVGRATWPKLAMLAAALLAIGPWSLGDAWRLTALRAGEDQARSMGVAVERLRTLALVRASLLAAIAVSFTGSIGFIGLVGPHIARLAVGEDHRFYLPASALAGALVLSLAALAGKTLVPGVVLPIGIVTALTGIPLLIGLLLTQRRTW